MSLKGKTVYVRKTGNSGLYKWAPQCNSIDSKHANTSNNNQVGEFCQAVAYASEGEDKKVKYVTNLEVVNGITKHNAYVACDYVQ